MKKEESFFWLGALLGIAGGIIGNVLTSSAFTLITNSCNEDIYLFCVGGTILLLISSFIIFLLMISKIMKKIKLGKNKK
jgi:cell division protein FtsX